MEISDRRLTHVFTVWNMVAPRLVHLAPKEVWATLTGFENGIETGLVIGLTSFHASSVFRVVFAEHLSSDGIMIYSGFADAKTLYTTGAEMTYKATDEEAAAYIVVTINEALRLYTW